MHVENRVTKRGKILKKSVRKKIHENGGKELKLTPNTN